MKKKVSALLMTVILCLALAVPCFAASFSEEEVVSRKRVYYPLISEGIQKLGEIRPVVGASQMNVNNAQIEKIFVTENGDYYTAELVEAERPNYSETIVPVGVYINLLYEGENWIFFYPLSDKGVYSFGKFDQSLYADVAAQNVTKPYASFLDVFSPDTTLPHKACGNGFVKYHGADRQIRYLLDIDVSDYQSSGYTMPSDLVMPVQEEKVAPSAEITIPVTDTTPTKEEPTEQYTKDQELIISGKTDFGYFYTYKDSLNYKCFSLTKDGKRFYASVREDLYDYYKNAFQNHSLTLKGKYQFTAEDGSPVVAVSTLVEGTKETNLRSYLWTLNKGTAKNPNFKAYADLKGDGLILSASKDGQSITIDSNPWGASKGSQAYQLDNALALIMIKELNSELGLPEWLYSEMVGTRALDGRQKEVFDYVTVTWSYHPDSGINILYRKNN